MRACKACVVGAIRTGRMSVRWLDRGLQVTGTTWCACAGVTVAVAGSKQAVLLEAVIPMGQDTVWR